MKRDTSKSTTHRPTSSARRSMAAMLVATAVLAAACGSGDDTAETPTDTAATTPTGDETTTTIDGTTPTDPELTGPSPGVTDETIKIGVTHVDTEALVAVGLNYDLGDHQAVYEALFADINAGGGINGRMLEPIYAPIDPTGPASADEACLQLTEDEDAFLVTGFFLTDAVLCTIDLHATAVVGGSMTPQRQEQAKAPWITWDPDTDHPATILQTLGERGELDGTVAVYVAEADSADLDDYVMPTLDALGVAPVATGIMDAPTDDTAALASKVAIIAEKFESEEADTIVLVGASGATWPQYMASNTSYRPKLLFLDITAARAFATSADTTDTSILEGSLAGGSYGPDQARFEEAAMQECVATLSAAGIDTPAPSGFDPDDRSNQPYQAAFQACPDVALLRAVLEAAGENLNYATLEAGFDGLEVAIPGDPVPRTFGPPPAADGDPAAYLFTWDEATKNFALSES